MRKKVDITLEQRVKQFRISDHLKTQKWTCRKCWKVSTIIVYNDAVVMPSQRGCSDSNGSHEWKRL